MKARVLLYAALTLTACARTETAEQRAARNRADTDSARVAIQARDAAYVRFVNANQPDSIGAMYGAQSVVMPPDMPRAVGPDSIAAAVRRLAVPGGTLTVTQEAIAVDGDIGVARGSFTYAAPAQGRQPAMTLRGKYMQHLHRVDGRWVVVDDIWNNDAPAPPMPAPR